MTFLLKLLAQWMFLITDMSESLSVCLLLLVLAFFKYIVGIWFTCHINLMKTLVKNILYIVYMIKLDASKGMHQNLKIAFNPCMNPHSMHGILLPQVLLCLTESTRS